MMNYLDWIFEIEDYEKHLKAAIEDREDLRQLYGILDEYSGSEAFIKLYAEFLKTPIKPVEKIISRLKEVYIIQNKNLPVCKLARKLSLEERRIMQILQKYGHGRNEKKS